MKDEYVIINKTALQKKREELLGSPHWDGIYTGLRRPVYLSDYQKGQIDLIDTISSQSTPLIPEIEKAFDAGTKTKHSIGCNADGIERKCYCTHERYCQYPIFSNIQDYIANLKLDL